MISTESLIIEIMADNNFNEVILKDNRGLGIDNHSKIPSYDINKDVIRDNRKVITKILSHSRSYMIR